MTRSAPPDHAAALPGPEALAAVLEATGAGIAVADASQPDHPLVYCNRAFLEMTGYGAEELLGRTPGILFGPDTDPRTVAQLDAAVTAGRPEAVEILNYRKDGTPFWNALTIRPLHAADGSVRWWVSSSSDVTRRRHSEEELREAQEQLTRLAAETFALAEDLDRAREDADAARIAAENASRAKSRFLAMMSHELRTPMTAVIGMGDLLMDTALDADQQGMVRTLRTSADTLLAILNDILDFSKIEAGQLELEDIDFSLERLVDDVTQLFLVRAAAKGLSLSASIADDTPMYLRGDPTRLRQILFNLIGNAIKFTETGGVELCVWRSASEDDASDGSFTVRFEVADTGVGMTAEQQGRLFQAFVQADASTSRKYGGTGLGLAICKRLVERMDGRIGVVSEPGRGSSFRFSIRLHPAKEAPPGADSRLPPPAGATHAADREGAMVEDADAAPAAPLHLLLAEDNAINRMLVTSMLTRMGHRVDAVENGREALDTLRAGTYDLLLLDMEMPVLDGGATARAIRAAPPPLAHLPIIGLSADALPEHRARHMASGLDDYLTKPIDWQRLDAVIRSLAHRPADRVPVSQPAEGVIDTPFTALPLLDRVKLAELRVVLGAESLMEMLRLMPETATRELDAVLAAFAAGRARDGKAAAHTLAGLAANFGAPRLAAIARAVNDRYQEPERIAALLPLLEETVGDTNRAFAARDIVPPDVV